MESASRTLVKSPPELWELIDQPDRMQGLMCALLGRATEVTVDQRKPESLLRWQAVGDGGDAWIEVELAEKGWGTNVKVKAENAGEPTKLEGWLDAVLNELATPQKRPFAGIGDDPGRKAPSEAPVPAAPAAATRVAAPVEAIPAEAPDAPEPPAHVPQPERPSKLRRFFGAR